MAAPRMCLILSENWTMTSARDLPVLVRWAREAEDAGFDSVMLSEHIVLGPAASANGLMANPREYALPGNPDPATPWPSSLVLLSAIAAVTTRIRLVASAVIAPLRHPLLLARELGSLDLLSGGRLVVQPTVSWLEEEYAALGVPFRQRGDLLDEHLAAWRVLWRDTPASFNGRHYRFRDVYFEPKAFRPEGPPLWPGGVRRAGRRGRPGPGAGRHRAAGAGRVHHVLYQAVTVHRRPRGGGAAVPGNHPPRGRDAALAGPHRALGRGNGRAGSPPPGGGPEPGLPFTGPHCHGPLPRGAAGVPAGVPPRG